METSDSEYFESADEDFQSDEESIISTKTFSKSEITKQDTVSEVGLKINKLEIQSSNTYNSLEDILEKSSKNEQSKHSLAYVESFKKEVNASSSNQSKLSNDEKSHGQSPIPDDKDSLICGKPKTITLSDKSNVDKNVTKKVEDKPEKLDHNCSKTLEIKTNLLEDDKVKWEDHEDLTKSSPLSDTKLAVSKSPDNKEKYTKSSLEQVETNVWDDDDVKWEANTKEQEHLTHSDPISDNKLADSKISIVKEKNTESSQKADKNLWQDDEVNWVEEDKLKLAQISKETNLTQIIKSNKINLEEENLWDEDEIDWETKDHLSHESASENSKDEDNLWQNDDWEPLEGPTSIPDEKMSQSSTGPQANSGWGSWNGWGVTSLLNTATQGVSTLTSHVSQGLSTVIEGGMGIPDPEQMAKENTEISKEKNAYEEAPNHSQLFGFGNLVGSVSHITKFVESTGTKVISGGLDTLETIGKKTMEVLQEGDPGLKKKRAFLKLDTGKPVLSQVLREAKEKAEKENSAEEVVKAKKLKSYETLFDDYHGLVHLEALEMLSRLSNIKLQSYNESMSGEALKELQETMEQVKELCELPDDDEEQQLSLNEITKKIDNATQELNVTVSYEKLLKTSEDCENWVDTINFNLIDANELHQQAIESLAQTTALAVEQFHKIGELLLVKEHRSTADEADSLVQLTTVLKALIVRQANKFTDKLSSLGSSDKTKSNELITNIFYEAANSSSYIQDAFQLLIPVLQVGAV